MEDKRVGREHNVKKAMLNFLKQKYYNIYSEMSKSKQQQQPPSLSSGQSLTNGTPDYDTLLSQFPVLSSQLNHLQQEYNCRFKNWELMQKELYCQISKLNETNETLKKENDGLKSQLIVARTTAHEFQNAFTTFYGSWKSDIEEKIKKVDESKQIYDTIKNQFSQVRNEIGSLDNQLKNNVCKTESIVSQLYSMEERLSRKRVNLFIICPTDSQFLKVDGIKKMENSLRNNNVEVYGHHYRYIYQCPLNSRGIILFLINVSGHRTNLEEYEPTFRDLKNRVSCIPIIIFTVYGKLPSDPLISPDGFKGLTLSLGKDSINDESYQKGITTINNAIQEFLRFEDLN